MELSFDSVSIFPKKQINHVAPEPPSEIADEHDGLERVLAPMQGIVDNEKSTSKLLSGYVSLRSAEVVGSPFGRIVKCEEFLKVAGPTVGSVNPKKDSAFLSIF
ncbi:hypothetical protein ZEAMMB73_Zm00001d035688 [Zea mays]|uniref:Uncharacterized protein n=1 Tax=Zea mays TaxID=4577 RepID=A0A1D6LHW1_MAIZE|nr:hypothetical protein ZEAMMB73_Zm00001d035688 [Zea mays]